MEEREASGDFDYLWDDPADADGLAVEGPASEPAAREETDHLLTTPGDDQWDDPDDSFWDNDSDSGEDGHFDAFDTNTWNFQPAPTPWYRTKQTTIVLVAAAAAVVAIVVSGVLLVFRGPSGTGDHTTPVTQTPTSAAPETTASSPMPPPPPPPPPETASAVNPAPGYNPPRVQPRPTKAPEIGVTRTPITRSPISVAPQPRGPR